MPHALPTNLNEDCSGALICMADWANDVTGGLFWTLVLLAFLVVLFMATQQLGKRNAFGFASFIGIFGAIFLVTLNLTSYWIASAFILVGVIGLGTLILSERG